MTATRERIGSITWWCRDHLGRLAIAVPLGVLATTLLAFRVNASLLKRDLYAADWYDLVVALICLLPAATGHVVARAAGARNPAWWLLWLPGFALFWTRPWDAGDGWTLLWMQPAFIWDQARALFQAGWFNRAPSPLALSVVSAVFLMTTALLAAIVRPWFGLLDLSRGRGTPTDPGRAGAGTAEGLPQARWANAREVADSFSHKGGIVLGELTDPIEGTPGFDPIDPRTWKRQGKGALITMDPARGNGHVVVIAASAGGKTAGIVIPNILHYDDPLVVVDPKGDLHARTRDARIAKGYKTRVIDAGHGFDPFKLIAPLAPATPSVYLTMAKTLMPLQARASDISEYFHEMACSLFAALMAHFIDKDSDNVAADISKFINRDRDTVITEAQKIGTQYDLPLINDEMEGLAALDERTFPGVVKGISNKLAFVRFPDIASYGSSNDPAETHLAALEPDTDIFINLPTLAAKDFSSFPRLLIGAMYVASELLEQPDRPRARRLFLIDEARVLGGMDALTNVRDAGRSIGMHLMLIYQSLGQLKEAWGGEAGADAWLDSCEARVVGAVGAARTASDLVTMLGRRTLRTSMKGSSSSTPVMTPMGGSVSSNEQEQLREVPLMSAATLGQLPAHGSVIFTRRSKPILATKALYFTRPDMRDRVLSPDAVAHELESTKRRKKVIDGLAAKTSTDEPPDPGQAPPPSTPPPAPPQGGGTPPENGPNPQQPISPADDTSPTRPGAQNAAVPPGVVDASGKKDPAQANDAKKTVTAPDPGKSATSGQAAVTTGGERDAPEPPPVTDGHGLTGTDIGHYEMIMTMAKAKPAVFEAVRRTILAEAMNEKGGPPAPSAQSTQTAPGSSDHLQTGPAGNPASAPDATPHPAVAGHINDGVPVQANENLPPEGNGPDIDPSAIDIEDGEIRTNIDRADLFDHPQGAGPDHPDAAVPTPAAETMEPDSVKVAAKADAIEAPTAVGNASDPAESQNEAQAPSTGTNEAGEDDELKPVTSEAGSVGGEDSAAAADRSPQVAKDDATTEQQAVTAEERHPARTGKETEAAGTKNRAAESSVDHDEAEKSADPEHGSSEPALAASQTEKADDADPQAASAEDNHPASADAAAVAAGDQGEASRTVTDGTAVAADKPDSSKSAKPASTSAKPKKTTRRTRRRKPGYNADEVRAALDPHVEALFRTYFGEPERVGTKEWRVKGQSHLSMNMVGDKRGQWYDFKTAEGGSLLDFIAIHICGLSEAGDDFPGVLEAAAKYAGLGPSQGGTQDKPRARTRRKAETDLTDAIRREAEEKEALVWALRQCAGPVAGTPAETYLASRALPDWPETGLAWLPPLKGVLPDALLRPVYWPEHGALVIWARDDSGTITGGQRILVQPDGTRVQLKPGKPCFGRIGGCPARLAARDGENTQLIIAEGPETALSIHLATGRETWVVFGASGWQNAPVPQDRPVILAPDQDARDSPAGVAFRRAVARYLDQGATLAIARPPEDIGSKRDFNDTLQRAGVEAVQDAIATARPPGPDDLPDDETPATPGTGTKKRKPSGAKPKSAKPKSTSPGKAKPATVKKETAPGASSSADGTPPSDPPPDDAHGLEFDPAAIEIEDPLELPWLDAARREQDEGDRSGEARKTAMNRETKDDDERPADRSGSDGTA